MLLYCTVCKLSWENTKYDKVLETKLDTLTLTKFFKLGLSHKHLSVADIMVRLRRPPLGVVMPLLLCLFLTRISPGAARRRMAHRRLQAESFAAPKKRGRGGISH